MQCRFGQHVDLAPEKLLEVSHQAAGKPGRVPFSNIDQQIHVALWSSLATRHGSKETDVACAM